MSTNSMIGVEGTDGVVMSITCHWDGYLSEVGATLHEHYTNAGKVGDLLALGNLSVLGQDIGERHGFDAHGARSDVCLAYGRDRGDPGQHARKNANRGALVRRGREWGAEYTYLYAGGVWHVLRVVYETGERVWMPIADAIAQGEQ